MAFEVQRTKETVKIYGTAYDIKQPTVKDAIEMSKKALIAEKNPDQSVVALEGLRDWVSSLGIPAQVIADMETKHFLSLVEYITLDPKKKAELIAGS